MLGTPSESAGALCYGEVIRPWRRLEAQQRAHGAQLRSPRALYPASVRFERLTSAAFHISHQAVHWQSPHRRMPSGHPTQLERSPKQYRHEDAKVHPPHLSPICRFQPDTRLTCLRAARTVCPALSVRRSHRRAQTSAAHWKPFQRTETTRSPSPTEFSPSPCKLPA